MVFEMNELRMVREWLVPKAWVRSYAVQLLVIRGPYETLMSAAPSPDYTAVIIKISGKGNTTRVKPTIAEVSNPTMIEYFGPTREA